LAEGGGLLRSKKNIILFSLIAFLALAKYGYFWSRYIVSIDTWSAIREAIALIQTKGSVYTTAEITPHLTHRQLIQFTNSQSPPVDLNRFDYVLLNVRYPGWLSSQEFSKNLIEKLENNSQFHMSYQKDDVYLFIRE
jgi:hypothetical protein